VTSSPTAPPEQSAAPSTSRVSRLAVDYLLSTRVGSEDGKARSILELAQLHPDELEVGLPDDHAKLAFWIDLYNAAVVNQKDIDFSNWPNRLRFLRRTVLTVAGRSMTLDAIEHGILRRSRWKLTLGYLHNPRPADFERRYRVERRDPRIHFALNCAAASCPPIAAYQSDKIEAQLDTATRAYLQATVSEDDGHILVPQLFLWYAGDFGGPPGIRSFLSEHGIAGSGRPIRFAPYDWTEAPGRWVSGSAPDETNVPAP
jgi:hypothetical protein